MDKAPTVQKGIEGNMFNEFGGTSRVVDELASGVDQIEFLFKDGLFLGYRDSNSKTTFFRSVLCNSTLEGDQSKFRDNFKLTVDELYKMFNC